MTGALAGALRMAAGVRARRIAAPKADTVRMGLARRPAEVVPFSPRPISILAPHHETPAELRAFVLAEFQEARRKRRR